MGARHPRPPARHREAERRDPPPDHHSPPPAYARGQTSGRGRGGLNKPTTTGATPLPKHRPTGHAKQITAQQEPGQPGSRSSTPGRRRADRRSAARRWPPQQSRCSDGCRRPAPCGPRRRSPSGAGGHTPLRGPARLVEQPIWHCIRHPSRELSDEGLRLGAQGATHTDGKDQKPQARRTGPVGWDGILARRQGPLEVAVRRAPRGVRVLARNPEASPAGSHVLTSKIV